MSEMEIENAVEKEGETQAIENVAVGASEAEIKNEESNQNGSDGNGGEFNPQGEEYGQMETQHERTLKVEDALTYLDEVKRQFAEQPMVYNKFLDIMKAFKSEAIDTPGVIAAVSSLFRGHNSLILGFNTFLPNGYRIEADSLPPDGFPMEESIMAANAAAMDPNAQAQNARPVEFDEAILYVTKIKKRFANDPDTYKKFLDILHTYQKEQTSIKEVLDEVSELFINHSDLLKEFTFFLPDAVREKAKQEINRINARRRKEEQRKKEEAVASGAGEFAGGLIELDLTQDATASKKSLRKSQPPVVSGKTSQVAISNVAASSSSAAAAAAAMQPNSQIDFKEDDESLLLNGKVPKLERRLFARIKAVLSTRERWGEFLKCLDLFSQDILSKSDLLTVITSLFDSHGELLDEFNRLLLSRGITDDIQEEAWYSIPMSEIDFSQSRRGSASYRALPVNYPRPLCSERTLLCRSVLNDNWVSVPTGSEDFSFKNMRKNQFEEALFKCEDDRYELDMIIDSNSSTIRVLDALAKEIAARKEKPFKIDHRTFNVIHLKSISRVYGERSTEILELLRKAPAAAVPVLLDRLKTKDVEWRKQRLEMNVVWRDVQEKNYQKSLDHRSFYFKQNERKNLAIKSLLNEIKETVASPDNNAGVTLEMGDHLIHIAAFSLISACAEKMYATKEEVEKFLDSFQQILSLLGTFGLVGKTAKDAKPGMRVCTRFGRGVVEKDGKVGLDNKTLDKRVEVKLSDCYLDVGTNAQSARKEFFVGQNGFLFLRFFFTLTERLKAMETLCTSKETQNKQAIRHVFDRKDERSKSSASPTNQSLFQEVIELTRKLVVGEVDQNKFEEDCCSFLGTNSFFLFTIDKLVVSVCRSAMACVSDEKAIKVHNALERFAAKRSGQALAEAYRYEADALFLGSVAACMVTFDEGEAKDGAVVKNPAVKLWFVDSFPHSTIVSLKEGDDNGEVDVLVPFTVTHQTMVDSGNENKKMNHLEIAPISFYFLKKVPGSEEVFRKIQKANESDPDAWWRDAGADSTEEEEEGGKKMEEEMDDEEMDEEDEVSDEKEE